MDREGQEIPEEILAEDEPNDDTIQKMLEEDIK